MRRTVCCLALLLCTCPVLAQKDNDAGNADDIPRLLAGLTSEAFTKLAEQTRRSVVVIRHHGRSRDAEGVGSGFVLSRDGLIATNLHVIGEARPISVTLFDGRLCEVLEVHAIDREQDLAILRVDAQDLEPLEMVASGEEGALQLGQPVFAIGNPLGLEHSVVAGIVSGFRELAAGRSLIQLAIPIEPGNSGGPLLDMQGRVHGLITLKSQVTDNLGYAVRIDSLRTMIESPHPKPIQKWLTIGALNPRLWAPSADAQWRQRAGQILADGAGGGFGGRSLCLSLQSPPERPYDIAVEVKLDQADGAAGLAFLSDGGDRHYGFYPSNGRLRLSRFDGPNVFTWNVLDETESSHFRPGEWNRLKVRIEQDRFSCYCNDALIFESRDRVFRTGQVGLVKFRDTSAAFKRFAVAQHIPSFAASPQTLASVNELADALAVNAPPNLPEIEQAAALDMEGQYAMQEAARSMEQRAQRLRQLAAEANEARMRTALLNALFADTPDLLRAGLLFSAIENPDLDVDEYLRQADRLAEEFMTGAPEAESEDARLQRFHEFLFEDKGFHGSRTDYYNASNSYLNEALDDREGLPITLAVIYLELARRVGIEAEGVGLPGHFIVRVQLENGTSRLVDVFNQGETLTEAECAAMVAESHQLPWDDSYLDAQPAPAIIERMARNLIAVANNQKKPEDALRSARTLLALQPDSAQDRMFRAVLCYATGRAEEGLLDVHWVLDRRPEGLDMSRVEQLREALETLRSKQDR